MINYCKIGKTQFSGYSNMASTSSPIKYVSPSKVPNPMVMMKADELIKRPLNIQKVEMPSSLQSAWQKPQSQPQFQTDAIYSQFERPRVKDDRFQPMINRPDAKDQPAVRMGYKMTVDQNGVE